MKARMSIRNIIMVMATISLLSMFFINICFAANTGKITTETARLREQPNTDSKVLELASLGDEVEILEDAGEWYKVKYKKITGYIRKDLMEVKNEETNTANQTNNVEIENAVVDNMTTENISVETSTKTEEATFKKGKYQISENAKLKIIPLINAIELDEIAKDAEVEVTEILNDWAKIKTADGKEGWVIINNLKSIETTTLATEQENVTETKPEETTNEVEIQQPVQTAKTMYVNSKVINVRQKADKTSQVIKQLSINTEVTVLSSDNGWAYVDLNGTKGYIAENLLSNTKQETSRGTTSERNTANTTQSTSSNTNITNNTNTTTTKPEQTQTSTNIAATSSTGSAVVEYAKQFLGCKYVYGGTTTSGFDCSGFTQYVYKHFGVNLNRTAAAQYSNGKVVTELQVGDLVMFGKSGIDHVGIYIGGNTFIHAANSKRGVTTDTLASGYYKTNYVGARRIF